MFAGRGFSYSTIRALVVSGIDAPERLLSAKDTDLLSIPGIDETVFREIARYRARFAAAHDGVPFDAPSATPCVSPERTDAADWGVAAPFTEPFATLVRADAQAVEGVVPGGIPGESGVLWVEPIGFDAASRGAFGLVEAEADSRESGADDTAEIIGRHADALARLLQQALYLRFPTEQE
jgi:hypothetical protein